MKKVTLINYTGSKGGGAQYTYELTASLINQGVPTVAIISSLNEDLISWKQLSLEKLIIIDTYKTPKELAIRSVLWNKNRKHIVNELAEYNVENVIVPMITFWTKRINQLIKDTNLIVVLHDPIPHSGDKNKRVLQLFGETNILKKADYIVVLSKMFIEYVEKKYNKQNRVISIPMGTTNLYKQIENKIQTPSYDESKVNFLFFGTISKYKGIEILGEAYKKVSEDLDNVTLTIAGSGDFSKYEEYFKDSENVNIYNRWIGNEEVESFFASKSVVVVLPYLDATQSGVIPVCISYGVPVIASNTGGLVQQLNDYETGILVQAGNSEELAEVMIHLATDKEEAEKQRFYANENAEKYSWKNITKRFSELLNV